MERYFHSELATLKSRLTLMGNKAVDAVRAAVGSLDSNRIELAEGVVAGDEEIDQLEITIDHEANRYLSLHAPVAADLRFITVAIRVSQDLERVGDEARTIAKRSRRILRKEGTIGELFRIPRLAARSEEMIVEALRCLVEEDVEGAKRLSIKDKRVDELHKENLKIIIDAAKNNPASMEYYVDLIFISRSLERIADHATNLAEETVFLKTAEDTRHLPKEKQGPG